MAPQQINTLSHVTSTCDFKTGREQNLAAKFTDEPRSYCFDIPQNPRIRLIYGKSPHSVRFLEGQIRRSPLPHFLPGFLLLLLEQDAIGTCFPLTRTSVSFATRLAHARVPHSTNSPLILYNLRS